MISYKKILVLGASGYIGSRLVPALLANGYEVRAASRDVRKLAVQPWAKHPRVEMISADVTDYISLQDACAGCDVGYYLVHSMSPGSQDFAAVDREAAKHMRQSAEEAGVKRLIYLGGLGDPTLQLSKHLQSRIEVAEILHAGKVPVTTLRAAMIMGAGSASFEILCYLVRRLPLMVTPKWVSTESQPIAVRNVIGYLTGCLTQPMTAGAMFDIGGPDIVTYNELMRMYALEAGLAKRIIIPVPVLTPRLSSYWIHLVTPIPSSLARPLAEGLKNRVVCRENRIQELITQDLFDARQSIRLSLGLQQGEPVCCPESRPYPAYEDVYPGDPGWSGGGRRKNVQTVTSHAPVYQ